MFGKRRLARQLLESYPEFASVDALQRSVVEGLSLAGIPDPETEADEVVLPAAAARLELVSGASAPPAPRWEGRDRWQRVTADGTRAVIVAYAQPHARELLESISGPGSGFCRVVFQEGETIGPHRVAFERGEALAIPFGFSADFQDTIRGPLFGRWTPMATYLAFQALEGEIPVVPVWLRFETDGWTLVIGEPIEPAGSAAGLTLAVLRAFEEWMRREHEHADWIRHPWRTRRQHLLWSRREDPTVAPKGSGGTLSPLDTVAIVPGTHSEGSHCLPAVRAIAAGRPDMALSVWTTPAMAPFWKGVSEVRQVLTPADHAPGQSFHLGVFLDQEEAAFEAVDHLDIHRRVGFEGAPYADRLDDRTTAVKGLRPPEHRSIFYLRIAHRLGAKVEGVPSLHEPLAVPAIRRAGGSTLRFGLLPFAEAGPSYRWPLDRFAALMTALDRTRSCRWRIFAGPGEDQRAEELRTLAGSVISEIAVADDPALLRQALQECDAFIGNQCEWAYLADALGVPGVVIYGPGEPALGRPDLGSTTVLRHHVECSPCFLGTCPLDHRCMLACSPEEVAGLVLERVAELETALRGRI